MPLFQLHTKQHIPATLEEVWDFISSPRNLKEITPAYMGFDITTKNIPEKMYTGMIVAYKVSPLLGIKMTWVTEITHVDEMKFFIDEQRLGPYKMWHHEHRIHEVDGGVMMEDIVSYIPPLGFLGSIANTLFIRSQLREIFKYREAAVEKRFGKMQNEAAYPNMFAFAL